MLQYRQNINYFESQANSIQLELAQLHQLLKCDVQDYDLYMNIREKIYKEIKIEQLACTRILRDILQIEKQSIKAKDIIVYFVVNNTDSYKQIGEHFNTSKQNIHQTLQRYAKDYIWLNNLVKIKGMEDAKNKGSKKQNEMD